MKLGSRAMRVVYCHRSSLVGLGVGPILKAYFHRLSRVMLELGAIRQANFR